MSKGKLTKAEREKAFKKRLETNKALKKRLDEITEHLLKPDPILYDPPAVQGTSKKKWKEFKDHLDNPNFCKSPAKKTSFATMRAVIDKLEQTDEMTDGLLELIVRFLKKEWIKKYEKEKRKRRRKEHGQRMANARRRIRAW